MKFRRQEYVVRKARVSKGGRSASIQLHGLDKHRPGFPKLVLLVQTNSFCKKLLHKKLVPNFLANNNRNTICYCSHNNREQKKNEETFSAEARPKFLIKKCVFLHKPFQNDDLRTVFCHFAPIFFDDTYTKMPFSWLFGNGPFWLFQYTYLYPKSKLAGGCIAIQGWISVLHGDGAMSVPKCA